MPARERVSPEKDAERLTALVRRREEHGLLEALRHLEPRIKSVLEMTVSGRSLLYFDLGEGDPIMPIALAGEGMGRLASVVLALCSVPGGLLLVDEIENGLHHRILPCVWEAIAAAAQDADVQVFATTHGYECVNAAQQAIPSGELLCHRLDRREDGIECTTYEPEILEAALEMPWEVR